MRILISARPFEQGDTRPLVRCSFRHEDASDRTSDYGAGNSASVRPMRR
jgi:hypothetical protein